MRPFATADSTSNGSSQVSMWTVDNSPFNNAHDSDVNDVEQVLASSATNYKYSKHHAALVLKQESGSSPSWIGAAFLIAVKEKVYWMRRPT